MTTFRDNQRLINIPILTIYFMLSEEERLQHKAMIRRLNRIKAFTLGLYEFKILTKLGGVNSGLSEDIKAQIEDSNLLVRLPNDSDDNFVYAFNNVDLSSGYDAVEEFVHNFVVELAKQSVAILKERQAADADNADLSAKLDSVVYSFEKAIESGVQSYARLVAPPVVSECRSESCCRTAEEERTINGTTYNVVDDVSISCDTSVSQLQVGGGVALADLTEVLGCLARHGIPASEQRMVAGELARIFAEMFGIPSREESSMIAGGILDSSSDAIVIDKYGRLKPSEKPKLRISVERVPYIDGRGKRRREKYGVRVSVGSFEQRICFEETTQTMVYVAALLRHKMGKRLYIHELRNNSAGTVGAREVAKQWLRRIYTTIITPENAAFDKWIESVGSANNGGKKLYTAISSTKRIIAKHLEMYPDAIYYTLMMSKMDAQRDRYYTFNCSPDDIIICGELQGAMQGTVSIY